ncbi:helix-turn-helix transcriptional regulator [Streptomyces pactum]|uniref:Helix-turn-helix transcriptional regulator n=1 Tax=Streptomyces pactum TaxID=68249 RepID=A0ABS0NQY8_9ACTN|nr:helix-turn-helix transcriptional regulator [Streptomyces pactum]
MNVFSDSNAVVRPARPSGPDWTPTAANIMLGRAVKDLRERAGLTQKDLAGRIHVSAATINRLENADTTPMRRTVESVIGLLGPDSATRDGLLMMLARTEEPEWFQHRFEDCTPDHLRRLLGLESMAIHITSYDVRLVSGLLQTPEYAAHIIRTGLHLTEWRGPEAERRLAQRLERQERVLGQADPPRCVFLMDESVLIRRVGPDEVMRGQLVRLRELTDLPHIVIRFVLFDRFIAGNAGSMAGSMAQLQFGRGGLPDLVYVEGYEKADYFTPPPRRARSPERPPTPRENHFERHLQLLLRIQGEACASPAESRRMLDEAISRYS